MADEKDDRLDRLEALVKADLGISAKGKGELTVEEAGKIGGQMVKRLIAEGGEARPEPGSPA